MESLVSGATGNQRGLSTAGLQSGRELVAAVVRPRELISVTSKLETRFMDTET